VSPGFDGHPQELADQAVRRQRNVEALAVLAGDRHPKVRAKAVNALWALSERMDEPQRTSTLAALRAVASDADSVVRANAVAGLAALHAPEAQGRVLAGLADPDWSVRTLSATAVCAIPEPGAAVAKLVELLDEDDPIVRQAAAGALGQVGEPRAVQPLRGRLTEERELQVRQVIEQALTSLEGSTFPLVREARPRARSVGRKGLTGQWAERLVVLFLVLPLFPLVDAVQGRADSSRGGAGPRARHRGLLDGRARRGPLVSPGCERARGVQSRPAPFLLMLDVLIATEWTDVRVPRVLLLTATSWSVAALVARRVGLWPFRRGGRR
jgi:hypothetical protein